MPSYTYGTGKGLREPCSPNRQAYFFGAPLGSVNADGWNCVPVIWDSATSFGLDSISINHEVVVAFLGISGIGGIDCSIRFRWYRERDNALIYEYTYHKGALSWHWMYAYLVIGYTNQEIRENGRYYVEIRVTGDISYSRTIYITVSGISEEVPEPVPATGALGDIITFFNSLSSYFYGAFIWVYSWPYPFNGLASPFFYASEAFSKIAWAFFNFSQWVTEISSKVASVFNWDTIWSYILTFIPNLEQIRDWFYYWVTYVWQEVNKWWSATQSTVQGWINIATQGLNSLIVAWSNFWNVTWPSWISSFNSLKSAWDNFWSVTFPNLVSFNWLEIWWNSRLSDVDDLMNTKLKEWLPFYDTLANFFLNPLDWVEEKFINWFLGEE